MNNEHQEPGNPGQFDEIDDESLEAGRWLFAQSCEFVRGVVELAGLPEPDRTEVAFAGRSNVGKSSLINKLTNRSRLAITSSKPGRTRQINYFDLADLMYLVDLPGYGYARASRSESEQWMALTRDYLRGRPNLRRVFLLVDARHGLKPTDLEVFELMDQAGVSYQVVLTKADKIKREALDQCVREVMTAMKSHPAAFPEVAITSAYDGGGIDHLRAQVGLLADAAAFRYNSRKS